MRAKRLKSHLVPLRRPAALGLCTAFVLGAPADASSQAPTQPPPAGGTAADTVAFAAPAGPSELPIFLTAGMAYGQRLDGCAQCASPENLDSFTGHLSVGKYLMPGLGLGVDASVWQRGHPGLPTGGDEETAGAPTKLVSRLGNASLVLSFQTWRVYFRAGVGVALGQQDIQDEEAAIVQAKGLGVGYTFGVGATVPLVSMVSVAAFANWNAGSYDLSSPLEVVQRDVRHDFIEIGFGLSLR